MRTPICLLLCLFFSISSYAQNDVQTLVETEHAFAQFALDNSTKDAFLKFVANDGVLFLPDKVSGREYWNARAASTGLLSWAPNYADISANEILGYTTGNWEYRPKGKDDTPTAFGDFITIWLRQPDGKYKFVVDIGVGHAKPAKYSTDWVSSSEAAKDLNEKNTSAADTANGFFEIAIKQSARKAYESYAADDIRLYREEKLPYLGKKDALKAVAADKGILALAKRSTFFGAADISYTTSTYTRSVDGKVIEKGNYMQIWKLKAGKWRIVLDIFKPVPEKS